MSVMESVKERVPFFGQSEPDTQGNSVEQRLENVDDINGLVREIRSLQGAAYDAGQGVQSIDQTESDGGDDRQFLMLASLMFINVVVSAWPYLQSMQ